jgi:DNA-binding NarL/FixJ family response regulator
VANHVFAREGQALTRREMDILKLVSKGLTYAEIADELHWPYYTIRDDGQCVLKKLGVKSRHHAVAVAYDKNLLP